MLNIDNETRKKLNVVFAKAFLNMIEKAKKGEAGFAYHEDIMYIDGYDTYHTPSGLGEIYCNYESRNLHFQHFGTLGEGKSFVLQSVTNEIPNPTPFNVDSFDVFTYNEEFNVNDNLREIIIEVLSDIKFEDLEMVTDILQSDINLFNNSKSLIPKNKK